MAHCGLWPARTWVLRTPVALWGENFKTAAMFTVAAGETKPFVLSYGPSHLPPPEPVDCHSALDACEKFWRDWTATTRTDGPMLLQSGARSSRSRRSPMSRVAESSRRPRL